MKLEKIEECNTHFDETRYVLSVNEDEIKLLHELLKKSKLYIPKSELTTMLISRINTMLHCFSFCFHSNKKFGKTFKAKEQIK